jgi:phage terminase large subunit-like protein
MPSLNVSRQEAARELLRRRRARRNLIPFITYTADWYVPGRVHEYVAAKLEQFEQDVRDGLEPRLMIFLPPRTGKTELVERFLAWCLGRNPDWPMIYTSYGASLAWEKSSEIRAILRSEEWNILFGTQAPEDEVPFPVVIDPRHSSVESWRILGHKGGLIASGVGGPITGKGGKIIVWDDPVKNREEADSPIISERNWGWYVSTLRTRGEPGCGIIGIMTRWSENDLAGRLETQSAQDPESDQWDIIALPALAEENDPLGREPGEALDPNRYNEVSLARTKASMSDRDGRDWEALYQQHPTPAGGTIYKEAWWEAGRNRFLIDDPARPARVVGRYLFIDTAIQDKESNDYTACLTFEVSRELQLYLVDLWEEHLAFPDMLRRIVESSRKAIWDRRLKGVVIEDRVSGTSAIQTLRAAGPSWLKPLIQPFMPIESKEQRARQASIWADRGLVWLPFPDDQVEWLPYFEDRLYKFPGVRDKDAIDAFDMGILYLEHYLEKAWERMVRRAVKRKKD